MPAVGPFAILLDLGVELVGGVIAGIAGSLYLGWRLTPSQVAILRGPANGVRISSRRVVRAHDAALVNGVQAGEFLRVLELWTPAPPPFDDLEHKLRVISEMSKSTAELHIATVKLPSSALSPNLIDLSDRASMSIDLWQIYAEDLRANELEPTSGEYQRLAREWRDDCRELLQRLPESPEPGRRTNISRWLRRRMP